MRLSQLFGLELGPLKSRLEWFQYTLMNLYFSHAETRVRFNIAIVNTLKIAHLINFSNVECIFTLL